MGYLIAILASLALLAAFIGLTALETRRGVRVFAHARTRLDAEVSRAAFIVAHVDLVAFAGHVLSTITERIIHDVAHAALVAVRAVERLLTRVVQYLRVRRSALQSLDASTAIRPHALSDLFAHIKKVAERARRAAPSTGREENGADGARE